jgi:two-component system sensor kinase FixL
MRSIPARFLLLFVLVALPFLAGAVNYSRLLGGIMVAASAAHEADLALMSDLVALQRHVDAVSVDMRLQPHAARQSGFAEVRALTNHLSARWLGSRELRPLITAVEIFARAAIREEFSFTPALTRRQVIVDAEIKNLLLAVDRRAQQRSRELANRLNRLTTFALSLGMIVLGFGGVIMWLFARRQSTRLRHLTRDLEKLSAAKSERSKCSDEIDGAIHALAHLQESIASSMVHRQYLGNLLNSMSEGVLVSDLMGRVAYLNAAAQGMFQTRIARNGCNNVERLLALKWSAIDVNGDAWYEGRLVDEESAPWVFARRTHLVCETGALQGTVYVVQDISASKELQKANSTYREQLARSERLAAFGTIGAIVAHKFNQPLSSVRLFLQQIQRELGSYKVSETIRTNLSESLAELGRIADITKQMVAAGRAAPVAQPLGGSGAVVAQAAERVCESLQDAARRRNVSLHNLCETSEFQVACAAYELEEILYCLINNSIQAAPEERPTQVTISVSYEGPDVIVVVCDTGRGISVDHLDRVFEWCFTTKPEGQGTGLGLAIVRSIVERHGGSIGVTSQENAGSRFAIQLPKKIEEQCDDSDTQGFYC